MPDMIAYCGLTCQTCPIYLATRQQSKEQQLRMRMEIIQLCKEHYGIQYELKDITDCDGCRAESGRLFSTCKTCVIRKCARKKKLENCSQCPDYACKELVAFFETDPDAKARLDELRRAREARTDAGDGEVKVPSSPIVVAAETFKAKPTGDPERN